MLCYGVKRCTMSHMCVYGVIDAFLFNESEIVILKRTLSTLCALSTLFFAVSKHVSRNHPLNTVSQTEEEKNKIVNL